MPPQQQNPWFVVLLQINGDICCLNAIMLQGIHVVPWSDPAQTPIPFGYAGGTAWVQTVGAASIF
jgi:hypothetical protein